MKSRLLLVFIFNLLVRIEAKAQCVPINVLYDNLEKANDDLGDRELLFFCIDLQKNFLKCSYKNDSIQAKILHLIGRSYWQLDSLALGEKYTLQAIKINLSKSNTASPKNASNSYLNLGNIERSLNNSDKSVQAFQNGIQIAQNYSDKIYLLPMIYQRLANLYYDSGNYQKCLSYAEIGESIAKNQGSVIQQVNNRVERIQALNALNNVKGAFELLKETNAMVGQLSDHKTRGFVLTQVADLYASKNSFTKAIEVYGQALTEFKEHLKNVKTDSYALFNCAAVTNNIGNIYLEELKDYSKALFFFSESLKYVNQDLARSRILGNIAESYSKQGNYELAVKIYEEALSRVAQSNVLGKEDNNPSAKLIRISPNKLYLLTLIRDKANTLLDYAKHNSNNIPTLKNALKTYMLADTMIDFMRWEHTGNVTKLFWRDKTRAMYEHAIETCNLLNDPVTAFYFFEKSRAVMLNDQLNELGANQQLSQQDAERERSLRQRISDLQNKLGESKPESKQYISLRNDLFHVQEEQQIFVKQLEKANPQYYAYKYDNRVATLKEIRAKVIPDGQALISYFVGDSAVYGLNVTANKISLRKINIADYKRYTQEFQRLLGNRENQNKEFGNYLTASNRLYELLLKPFGIKSGRVIISPDGNFMPFESLSFSSSKPEFLVKKYAFSYTYSAGFLTKTFRSKSDFLNTKMFFGMAPGTFSPKLVQASLPGSELALETINKHFLFSKIVTGADASRKTFLTELSDHRIIQLLTHASADSSEVEPTLYFADSTLKLSELPTSGLSKTQLLVLSACRTGVGKNQKGEGVFSLARGFAGIGIPSTLTTLWSVENKSIYELTELFYNQLDNGLPLDVALQQAQIEWLQTASKSDQLPYAWAGMVLVGNTEPVETGISKGGIYVILTTTAFALLLAGFLFRRKMAAHR
ncbi:CHAT domain-containing tetratricopeptide repeat protein [Dyadobacter sp. LHD-138]|uniref:CHAT domain-containing protein n=1 Tax=Dyadobacter sp. LHD-138 TaxID=3071413 RepID=UPI0027E09B91|nr:CHAT domain-containing tetratricopeptide repeat protein [Dyadobacter sp. LHD-138]MDQ6478697.1 CHAT domain-containing tetratricopeptide repeat protein [Dyadobacter sp. LHD-138]